MRKVLVTIPAREEHKLFLERGKEMLSFQYIQKENVTEDMIAEAEVILGNVPPELLKRTEKLRLLQLDSAGAVPYTAPGVMPAKARLVNATGAYGLAIAEHMVGCVFMLMKKLNLYQENMRLHAWKDEGMVPSIDGAATLVVGLGDIGGQFAKKMHALGSRVTGVRRNKAAKPEYLDELCQTEELDRLLGGADIVACCLPGTPETEGMFSRARLERMKKGAILLNVGRGNLIPTEDLIAVLKSGRLSGAAVDVAETEPLPEDSPLWDAPNLLITPHVSGNYHMAQILETVVKIAEENLEAYLSGKPLRNEVDFSTGYRKFEE